MRDAKGCGMQDYDGLSGEQSGCLPGSRSAGGLGLETSMDRLLMAETLGLAMARRAADILERHRDALASAALGACAGPDSGELALDDAIFTAVLDAANECLGRFDSRPAADRWCDALLCLLDLARSTREAN
jgi:hypothetical protein